jgi:hypothetical protein
MTKEEALAFDLALEALENSVDLVREDAYNAEKLYGNYPSRQGKVAGLKVLADDHEKAITAIKQVRALDKKAENARELGLDYGPVAWSDTKQSELNDWFLSLPTERQAVLLEDKWMLAGAAFLAGKTTPPAAQPAPEQYTALEQALTRLQKRYAELEAKVAAQPAVPLTDDQVDAATKAWFENDIVAGRYPFGKRMRAAFAAAHGITEKGQL